MAVDKVLATRTTLTPLPGNILETQNLMPLYGLTTLWTLHFNKIPEGLISSINLRIIGLSKIKPNTQKQLQWELLLIKHLICVKCFPCSVSITCNNVDKYITIQWPKWKLFWKYGESIQSLQANEATFCKLSPNNSIMSTSHSFLSTVKTNNRDF